MSQHQNPVVKVAKDIFAGTAGELQTWIYQKLGGGPKYLLAMRVH